MKVREVLKLLGVQDNPDEELVICWWNKPPGMSDNKWVEVCKIFDETNTAAGRAHEQIYHWIESQRDEIPALGYDETEGEQNNAKTR